jgi:hypothetical protein
VKKFVMMLLLAIPTVSLAQTVTLQKSILCGEFKAAVEHLKTQYGEKAIWQGKTNIDTTVIFYLNPETNSWTLIETNGDLACSISVGESIEVLNKVKFN